MSRALDLAGRRFGALIALRVAPAEQRKYGRRTWVCRCDCGRECLATAQELVAGRITSCGCRANVSGIRRGRERPEAQIDLAGRRCGELTAIRRVGVGVWLWRCSCGAEITARSADVIAGRIISCGHVLRERARQRVVEENIFGRHDGTMLSALRGVVRGTVRSTNSSGATGVRVRRRADGTECYQARIMLRGVEYGLGTYDTLEEAAEARRRAEERMFVPILEEHGWKR